MAPVNAPAPSIFGPLENLPHGRHKLSRAEVAASQRARLMAAATAVMGTRGFAATTVTEVVRTARVSPNLFYAHFANLEECVLAAYDVYVAELASSITNALASVTEPDQRVGAAIGAYLEALDRDRPTAQAFLIEIDAVGVAARRKRREGVATFAALVEREHAAMRERDPSLAALPASAYVAIGHGVRGQACDALETAGGTPLTELVPEIVQWIEALVRGAGK